MREEIPKPAASTGAFQRKKGSFRILAQRRATHFGEYVKGTLFFLRGGGEGGCSLKSHVL